MVTNEWPEIRTKVVGKWRETNYQSIKMKLNGNTYGYSYFILN